jgi:hypothetical protein
VGSSDVAPDGKQILVTTSAAAQTAGQTTFVVINDWFTDLLRRASLKR